MVSPFSVALGRILWLRIPLTLIMGAKRKLRILSLAVVISSLIYDGTFIITGAIVGTTTHVEPLQITLFSLGVLTIIYGITFIVRRLIRLCGGKRNAPPSQAS